MDCSMQHAWSSVAGMVKKSDNSKLVPAGALVGEATIDQRLIMIKDKERRREDAVKLLKELANKPSMMWMSAALRKECEFYCCLMFWKGLAAQIVLYFVALVGLSYDGRHYCLMQNSLCSENSWGFYILIPVYLSLVEGVWESLMAYTSVESIPKSGVGPHASIWRAVLVYPGSSISQVLVPSGSSIPGSATLVSLKFWLRFRFFSTCSAPVTGFNICTEGDST